MHRAARLASGSLLPVLPRASTCIAPVVASLSRARAPSRRLASGCPLPVWSRASVASRLEIRATYNRLQPPPSDSASLSPGCCGRSRKLGVVEPRSTSSLLFSLPLSPSFFLSLPLLFLFSFPFYYQPGVMQARRVSLPRPGTVGHAASDGSHTGAGGDLSLSLSRFCPDTLARTS